MCWSEEIDTEKNENPHLVTLQGGIVLCIGYLIFHPPSSILSIPNRLLQRSLQTVLSCRIYSECDNNYGDILLAAPHRGYQDYPGRLCRSISSITPLLDVSPSSPTPKLVTLLRYSIRS